MVLAHSSIYNQHLQVNVSVQNDCRVTTPLKVPVPSSPLKNVLVEVVVSVMLALM